MKKPFFVALIVLSNNLFAQECIPNPVKVSEELISCLKQKDKKCITDKMISWQTVGGLYDSAVAKNKDNKEFVAALPSRDSIKSDYESKALSDLIINIDSLLTRGERLHLNWNTIVFEKEQSKISKENQMADDVWFNTAKVKFGSGDSSYVIVYEAVLGNGKWEIVDLKTSMEVLDSTGKPLGLMSEVYKDYAAYKNPVASLADTDSVVVPQAAPSPAPKKPVKKPPQKNPFSTSGQPATKPQKTK